MNDLALETSGDGVGILIGGGTYAKSWSWGQSSQIFKIGTRTNLDRSRRCRRRALGGHGYDSCSLAAAPGMSSNKSRFGRFRSLCPISLDNTVACYTVVFHKYSHLFA